MVSSVLVIASHKTTSLECLGHIASILCNFSRQARLCQGMVDAGIVPLMGIISSTTSSEQGLRDCAATICNISSKIKTAKLSNLVEQGVLDTLMTNCLVRSVSDETKRLCARAMLNICCSETFDDNMIKSMLHVLETQLSRKRDQNCEANLDICSSLFYALAEEKSSRVLEQRLQTVEKLYGLIRSKHKPTQVQVFLFTLHIW